LHWNTPLSGLRGYIGGASEGFKRLAGKSARNDGAGAGPAPPKSLSVSQRIFIELADIDFEHFEQGAFAGLEAEVIKALV
jgi:hypothetical protein